MITHNIILMTKKIGNKEGIKKIKIMPIMA